MGEYEPNDSRNVTQSRHRAPGEPERTGPQEAQTRQQQQGETELEQDESGHQAEQTVSAEHRQGEPRDAQPPASGRGGMAPGPGAGGRND